MPTLNFGANTTSEPFWVDRGSVITISPTTATVTYTTTSVADIRNGVASFDPLPLTNAGSQLISDGMWVRVASASAMTVVIDPNPSTEVLKPWVGDYGPLYANVTVQVLVSRAITDADNGKTLECSAAGLTLTLPTGLQSNFGCAIIPSGTTSIASSGGALLNGATSTLTRAAASNFAVAIIARASSSNSYVVTGT